MLFIKYILFIILFTLISLFGIYLDNRAKDSRISKNKFKTAFEGQSQAYVWNRGYRCYLPFSEIPTLPVEKFIQFYRVDPDKWNLSYGCAYRTDDPSAAIKFTPYKNFIKYEIFRKEIEKEHKKFAEQREQQMLSKKQDEKLEKVLNLVQKDIDNLLEIRDKELKQAKEITEKILKEV